MHIQKIDNTNFGAGKVTLHGMNTNITKKAKKQMQELADKHGVNILVDNIGGVCMPTGNYMIYVDRIADGAVGLSNFEMSGLATLTTELNNVSQNAIENLVLKQVPKKYLSNKMLSATKDAIKNLT